MQALGCSSGSQLAVVLACHLAQWADWFVAGERAPVFVCLVRPSGIVSGRECRV